MAGDKIIYDDIENIRTNLMLIDDEALAAVLDGGELPPEHRRYFSFALACRVLDVS